MSEIRKLRHESPVLIPLSCVYVLIKALRMYKRESVKAQFTWIQFYPILAYALDSRHREIWAFQSKLLTPHPLVPVFKVFFSSDIEGKLRKEEL